MVKGSEVLRHHQLDMSSGTRQKEPLLLGGGASRFNIGNDLRGDTRYFDQRCGRSSRHVRHDIFAFSIEHEKLNRSGNWLLKGAFPRIYFYK